MTKEQQVDAWMAERPVVRMSVNGEIVELSGDDAREHYARDYDAIAEIQNSPQVLRSAERTALRQQWDALPDYIRGPFRDKFEAANRLLDEGDDDAAIALIEYAEAPASFDATQLATFAATQAAMKAGIEGLTQNL